MYKEYRHKLIEEKGIYEQFAHVKVERR